MLRVAVDEVGRMRLININMYVMVAVFPSQEIKLKNLRQVRSEVGIDWCPVSVSV